MKWEYKIATLWPDVLSETDDNITSDNQELLNQIGEEGWELVSVDSGIAYFKRAINYVIGNVTQEEFDKLILKCISRMLSN